MYDKSVKVTSGEKMMACVEKLNDKKAIIKVTNHLVKKEDLR